VPAVVSALSIAPVKGMRLRTVPRIEFDRSGARGDRAFYVIDERDRMVNGKGIGELQQVEASYDPSDDVLRLEFPGGRRMEDSVVRGEQLQTRFFSARRLARALEGPWAEALSSHFGRPLRLVAPESGAVDRGPVAAATLISTASLERLAERGDQAAVDARRFRMSIQVDGVAAHEEDRWVGRELGVGGADGAGGTGGNRTTGGVRLRANGNVGRCLVTSRDPESGEIDLPTLDLLGDYRRHVASTEPLPFGIYAEVLEPGVVSVGDRLQILHG
jgi:uncharacterized protein YcbX